MERVTIIKPREDKGGDKCCCRVNWKKMPNCANTAESRVGRSADVLDVQFYAHVSCENGRNHDGTITYPERMCLNVYAMEGGTTQFPTHLSTESESTSKLFLSRDSSRV